jgi:FkbM family methyltransferase
VIYAHGWYFPDGERHLIEWMDAAKNKLILNGRASYQGKKQLAALEFVTAARRARNNSGPSEAVDVGAHIGLWSWNLAHWFHRVEAFEPVAEHRACWLRNMEGFAAMQLNLHPVALGAAPDLVSMRTEPTSSGDTRVHRVGSGDVEMRTLDSYGLENVDLIKVDVEGMEQHVLEGAVSTMLKWWPVVIVEQKRDMHARFGLPKLGAVSFLQGLGWRVELELSGDYILSPPRA